MSSVIFGTARIFFIFLNGANCLEHIRNLFLDRQEQANKLGEQANKLGGQIYREAALTVRGNSDIIGACQTVKRKRAGSESDSRGRIIRAGR